MTHLQKILENQLQDFEEKFNKSFFVTHYWHTENEEDGTKGLGERRKDAIKTFLSVCQRQIIEEVREEINTERQRFKCAACDGAKCGHTQCCQTLFDLQSNLKYE